MLVRLGIQRLLQELLEGEQRDFLGVDRSSSASNGEGSATATSRGVGRQRRDESRSRRLRYATPPL